MRIVILHFLDVENKKHSEILKKLVDSANKNGHQVDLINGNKEYDTFRITPYEYVTVVSKGKNVFSSKVPQKVTEVLNSCGTSSGKKACALVLKQIFFSETLCRNLMKVLDKEGMIVDYFNVIENPDHAIHIGKKLG